MAIAYTQAVMLTVFARDTAPFMVARIATVTIQHAEAKIVWNQESVLHLCRATVLPYHVLLGWYAALFRTTS